MGILKTINVGFGNIVFTDKIVGIISPDSAPIKRMVADARASGRLVDATCGRRTRAVIVSDSGHIVLSAMLPETLASRAQNPELKG